MDVAAERHHRRRTEQPDVDAVHAKACALCCHRQIAGGDKLATSGGCDPVDLGDNGLGDLLQAQHHLCAAREEIGKIGCAAILCLPPGCHLAQVMARAECLAPPGDHHNTCVRVLVQAINFGLQGCQHFVRQCVQPLGRIQMQGRDPVAVVTFQNCHLVSSLGLRPTLGKENNSGKENHGSGI